MCTFVASRFHTHSAPRASQFVELLNRIAPDFTLESDSSEEITLSSLRGKTVVLYFSDKDHKVAERYGLWVEKTFWGRKYMGVERTTYIIGPDGKIKKIFAKVNAAGHAAEVQAALK